MTEEQVCTSTTQEIQRFDILVYHPLTKIGYMLDPTIRMERDGDQAKEVDEEKRNKYKDSIPDLLQKFNLVSIDIIGLYIGVRGTITKFFEEFRKKFHLPKSMVEDIVISVLKGSTSIAHNHLYSNLPST